MIVVSCTSGLCNRIHAILGARIMARKLDRDLAIFWVRNDELDIEFRHLFVSNDQLIPADTLLFKLSRPEMMTKILNSGFTPPFEVDAITDSDHDMLFIKPWFVPLLAGEHMSAGVYAGLAKELESLAFNPAIIKSSTPEAYRHHVGIHVRYGDPQPNGSFRQTDYFRSSSIEMFKRFMEGVSKKLPGTRFYVASPAEFVKEDLVANIDVDTRPINTTRTLVGVHDAVVDLINLSTCAFCLGSQHSQFSKMVGLMSGKPVGVVSNGAYALDYGTTTPATFDDITSLILSGVQLEHPSQDPHHLQSQSDDSASV